MFRTESVLIRHTNYFTEQPAIYTVSQTAKSDTNSEALFTLAIYLYIRFRSDEEDTGIPGVAPYGSWTVLSISVVSFVLKIRPTELKTGSWV
jgi:hypothetical protein